MTPITNKKADQYTEPFKHFQDLPPAGINPFSSVDFVIQLGWTHWAVIPYLFWALNPPLQTCSNHIFFKSTNYKQILSNTGAQNVGLYT